MKRVTAQWVRKAEADYALAKLAHKAKPPFYDSICFHCQQSAEKFLKALLQESGQVTPRTHNLVELLNRLVSADASLGTLRVGLKSLTQYAVDYRYPGFSANARKAQAALRWAERLRRECRLHLGLSAEPRR